MNTKEYKILQANTPQELQILVNQAIMEDGKDVSLLGGLVTEIHPMYTPRYYQAILIIDEKLLLEKFGIASDVPMIPTVWTEPTPVPVFTGYNNRLTQDNKPAIVSYTEEDIKSKKTKKNKGN